MSSTLVSAQSLITDSLEDLGVYGVGQTLSAQDANKGLRKLNSLMGSWSIQTLTVPSVVRTVFTNITANVGTYTIGPGATFDTIRPPNGLQNAALLLNSATPAVEIPVGILTDQAYQAIPIKSQTNTLWTQVYYNPTFVTLGWGTITLWPIPTIDTNDLVLYFLQPLTEFADLTTQYQIPPGYEDAITDSLVVALAPAFGRPVTPEMRKTAQASVANIKRANVKMSDMANDAALISAGSRRFGYNITTDGYT